LLKKEGIRTSSEYDKRTSKTIVAISTLICKLYAPLSQWVHTFGWWQLQMGMQIRRRNPGNCDTRKRLVWAFLTGRTTMKRLTISRY